MLKLFNIPKAAKAIPYIPAKEKDTKMVIAMLTIGMIVDKYPKANPLMIFIAAPDLHDSASLITGLFFIKKNYP